MKKCEILSFIYPAFPMDSHDLAKYMEATDRMFQPWLLVQLRLKKLQERKHLLSPEDYEQELAELHQDLMNLGEWWVGREEELFGS